MVTTGASDDRLHAKSTESRIQIAAADEFNATRINPNDLHSQDHDDSVNSLVFGNDLNPNDEAQTQADTPLSQKYNILEDTQKIPRKTSLMSGINEDTEEESNINTDATFELQEELQETPFLDKLRDAFEETIVNDSKIDNGSPSSPFNHSISNDTFTVPQRKRETVFSRIREQANDSCLKYESQVDPEGTSEVSKEAPTQKVVGVDEEFKHEDDGDFKTSINTSNVTFSQNFHTQEIGKDSQRSTQPGDKDTQVVLSLSQTLSQAKLEDQTQRISDSATQADANRLPYSIDDTQKVESHSNSTPKDITLLTLQNSATVQIPGTDERNSISHRQVVNTQEAIEVTLSMEEYSDMQTQTIKETDDLEVLTDEEKEQDQMEGIEEEDDKEEDNEDDDEEDDESSASKSGNQYEDSLLTHKLKRKYKSQLNFSPRKRSLRSNGSTLLGSNRQRNAHSAGPELASYFSKTPITLKVSNTTPLQLTSPANVADSSPVINKTDILKLPNKSSPTKEHDQSIRSDIVIDSDITLETVKNPSTSPIAHAEEHTEYLSEVDNVDNISAGSLDSELEDIDSDYQGVVEVSTQKEQSEDKSPKHSVYITTRRRRNYIVDTQSQPDVDNSTNINNNALLVSNSSTTGNGDKSIDPDNVDSDGILRSEASDALNSSNIIFHDSVWASYNLKMYSGAIVQRGYDVSKVEFVEGISDIKNADLFLLDIRIGDIVRTRSSTAKYVVTGLSTSDSVTSIKCVRGYNLVYLQRKTSKGKSFDEFSISLSECFMEVGDWIQRQQKYSLVLDDGRPELLTQSDHGKYQNARSSEIPQTPSKSRTLLFSYSNDLSLKLGPFSSPPRGSSRSSPKKAFQSIVPDKIFSGMLFCITSIEGERKDQIRELIEENGGILFQKNLNELFDYSESEGFLTLGSKYLDNLKFGAIISNNHCRSAKYLSGLALGWPILSDSFIEDCIKDSSKLQSWPVYLLPAGHSLVLNALKSLDVFKFRSNFELEKPLTSQLRNNSTLLQKFDIIVLNNKINANTLETCKFIFYSFGAKSLVYNSKQAEVVKRLKDLASESSNNEVMVYDDGNTMEAKLIALKAKNPVKFETSRTRTRSQARRPKSRNKASRSKSSTPKNFLTVRVINWEWVVQCVISGFIWDTDIYTIEI
ncbi:fungal Rad9-like Rad53-binding-domain-containing protein [Scheffersomyces xylosifermentans]|uniref:fungal Rad9-like Rad53-binding-domain-containing protein n=1 Tax=Scheffersomyces xylosifermentans TaxID=1304137 RepID=UPI00315D53B7